MTNQIFLLRDSWNRKWQDFCFKDAGNVLLFEACFGEAITFWNAFKIKKKSETRIRPGPYLYEYGSYALQKSQTFRVYWFTEMSARKIFDLVKKQIIPSFFFNKSYIVLPHGSKVWIIYRCPHFLKKLFVAIASECPIIIVQRPYY